MEAAEIIETMSKPRSAALVNKYKIIFKIATGKNWNSCLCGNGFDRLWKTCKNYSNALEAQLKTKQNV